MIILSKIELPIIMAAQHCQKKWGIPASISLAQFAIESGWGKYDLGCFNYFGMKARTGDPFVIKRTREWSKAKGDYFIEAKFRKFKSPEEAFDEHGKLLGTAPVYAKCRAKLPDVNAFANSLTGVYATDPNYGKVLIQVMKGSNLYQYDT